MKSKDIIELLEYKHRGDFFADEVLMGSGGSKRIDAIAVLKKWSPVTVIGYEIKVSRADFLSDQKYPEYMKVCNLFYFIAPKGIIDKNEIPKEVGLIELNPDTFRTRTVKKAPYNQADKEYAYKTYLHCLMWKTDKYNRPKTKKEMFEDAKVKLETNSYGHELAYKIKKMEEEINRLKRQGNKNDMKDLREKIFKERGITLFSEDSIINAIPKDAKELKELRWLKKDILRIVDRLENGS